MSYYKEMKRCSQCNRITKATYKMPERTSEFNRKAGFYFNCPLEDDCEAPPECHAQIGIGVCTLGASCIYDEGHSGPHSYYPKNTYSCNKHPEGCTKQLKCKPCKGKGRGGHKGCKWICPDCNGTGKQLGA